MSSRSLSILIIAGFIALFTLAGQAAAIAPIDLQASLQRIDRDLSEGFLTYEQALVQKVRLVTGREVDPQYIVTAGPGTRFSDCGTPVLLEAQTALSKLSIEAQEEIIAALSLGDATQAEAAPPAIAKGRSPRPGNETPFSFTSEHFIIKWGTIDPPDQATVELIAQSLEKSWDVEVVDEGYPVPTNSDDYFVDAYIGNTGAAGENVPEIPFTGAYTSSYYSGGGLEEPVMAYIVYHPEILEHTGYLKLVSAHEFFHVLQGAIQVLNDPYGYRDYVSAWWIEATAVWITDVVYDESDSYVYNLNFYLENPEMSLHDSDWGQPHAYAMVIWAKYISENFGGNQAIYDLWIDPHPDGILIATDELIAEQTGGDLFSGYTDFIARVATRDFKDGALFDEVKLTDTIDEYPFVQNDDDLAAAGQPKLLGSNFYRLLPAGESGTLRLLLDGQDSFNDNDIDWNVAVIALTSAKGDYEILPFETSHKKEQGFIDIPGFGEVYEEIWFVPSPYPGDLLDTKLFNTKKEIKYAWAAEILPEEQDEDDDDQSGDDDDDDACGC